MSTHTPTRVGTALAVARKELRVVLLSPAGWVFLTAALFLSGVFMVRSMSTLGEASLRPVLADLSVALLFLLPWLTMRQLAAEARDGSLELLLAAPVSPAAVVIGKWLSSSVVCGLLLLGLCGHVAVLALYGDPDWGVVLTSLGALAGVCALGSAAGLFASSLTRDPVVAGVLGTLFVLPLWLADGLAGAAGEGWRTALSSIALLPHLRGPARGVLDSADVIWFTVWTVGFLLLAWRSLESRRWR